MAALLLVVVIGLTLHIADFVAQRHLALRVIALIATRPRVVFLQLLVVFVVVLVVAEVAGGLLQV